MSVASAIAIRMPRLSDSMEEGTIVRWLRSDGDAVAAGEPIVEIETDKATIEYESEATGVLEIVAGQGNTVALGEVIAQIVPGPAHARTRATPVARRLAAELGIDLEAVRGTGRRGQVMKADVERQTPASPPVRTESRRVELTRVQQRIAARMAESRAVVPDFALEVEIDMDECVALRAQLTDHADPVPSINDMVLKACALALLKHPRVNGAYRDGGFELHDEVNVGFAVAASDSLLVPVIRNADGKRLTEIARETRALAAKARDGASAPPELSGATFTVSNLGMFGITRFTAVINPPQAAILAVGGVQLRPVVRDGQLAVGHTMSATLASDHRILYGADAAAFLAEVRDRLQSPIGLVV
jgi:pyruvate dehydrogenase E2 component (dihydrolipoyllysine-residue acetyltransferase)